MMVEDEENHRPKIKVTATCVRGPPSLLATPRNAINIEFEDHLDENEPADILRESPRHHGDR